MENLSVRVNNQHGLVLLKELEAVGVISIEKKTKPKQNFNGRQFRGIVPITEKERFKQHFENTRVEWERVI
jgi:hypothetical protein